MDYACFNPIMIRQGRITAACACGAGQLTFRLDADRIGRASGLTGESACPPRLQMQSGAGAFACQPILSRLSVTVPERHQMKAHVRLAGRSAPKYKDCPLCR